MSIGVFPKRFNWGRRIHHPMGCGYRLKTKEKGNWAPALISWLCDLRLSMTASSHSSCRGFPAMMDCIFDGEPARFLPPVASAWCFITMTETKATNTKASGNEELSSCLRVLKGVFSLSRWVSQVDLPLKAQWSAHISPNPSFYFIFMGSLCPEFMYEFSVAAKVSYWKHGRLQQEL